MKKWRASRFTRAIASNDGELLLHNSFMGSLAKVPSELAEVVKFCLSEDFDDNQRVEPIIDELCEAGFFVVTDIDERSIVEQVLEAERELYFKLIILPHENCNFRCTYCYERFERGLMQSEVVEGLKAFIARKVQEIRGMSVTWFGGEPLLARNRIYELSDFFLQECEKHAIKYDSFITTNGYLLEEETVDALLRRQITTYQVTLDGPETLHNQTRKLANGQGTYQKIFENLKAMSRRSDDFSVTIRINFSNQHTPQALEPFFQQMQSTFGSDSRFRLKFNVVSKWGGANDDNLDVCDPATAATLGAQLIKEAEKKGFPQEQEGCLLSHGAVCYAGKPSSIVVGADGTIYKCTLALNDPLNKVGRMTRSGEIEINQTRWNQWTKLDDKNVSKCSTCSYNPICQSRSCPLRAIQLGEPKCPITREGYEQMVAASAKPSTQKEILAGWRLLDLINKGSAPPEVCSSRFGRWDYQE
ncbi:MAG: radical SAM protein [Crocosphaera sp.]|nr:radical SAM protein [Crocosphaera sp.]